MWCLTNNNNKNAGPKEILARIAISVLLVTRMSPNSTLSPSTPALQACQNQQKHFEVAAMWLSSVLLSIGVVVASDTQCYGALRLSYLELVTKTMNFTYVLWYNAFGLQGLAPLFLVLVRVLWLLSCIIELVLLYWMISDRRSTYVD